MLNFFKRKKKKEEIKEEKVSEMDRVTFLGFILRDDSSWSRDECIKLFKDEWGSSIDQEQDETNPSSLGYEKDGIILVALESKGKIPTDEAEHFAKYNYMWEDAVDVVKSHETYIIVSVSGPVEKMLEIGKLFTQISTTILMQKGALAIYSDGAVYEPAYYIEATKFSIKEIKSFPILTTVWFGVYTGAYETGVYTYGLNKFGKRDFEVYTDKKKANLSAIRSLLVSVAEYVVEQNITIEDGHTLGSTEDQKLLVTLSKGIALDEDTLKINIEDADLSNY